MSTVSGLGLLTQPTSATTATGVTSKEVGKSEFLKLLVTQLQNQDPMNPVDNQQFIAQLASFSSLEQLISINQSVAKLASLYEETRSAGPSP